MDPADHELEREDTPFGRFRTSAFSMSDRQYHYAPLTIIVVGFIVAGIGLQIVADWGTWTEPLWIYLLLLTFFGLLLWFAVYSYLGARRERSRRRTHDPLMPGMRRPMSDGLYHGMPWIFGGMVLASTHFIADLQTDLYPSFSPWASVLGLAVVGVTAAYTVPVYVRTRRERKRPREAMQSTAEPVSTARIPASTAPASPAGCPTRRPGRTRLNAPIVASAVMVVLLLVLVVVALISDGTPWWQAVGAPLIGLSVPGAAIAWGHHLNKRSARPPAENPGSPPHD